MLLNLLKDAIEAALLGLLNCIPPASHPHTFGKYLGATLGVEVGTLGTLVVFWSNISLSCSRILRLSEFGGGNRSFEMVDLSVTLKSWRTARSRSSSLDEIGIFKSPCGNHRTVSAMRTIPVEGTSTR
eukprot:scaffold10334_cov512-Chaetoceros_neogracile.AAC.1